MTVVIRSCLQPRDHCHLGRLGPQLSLLSFGTSILSTNMSSFLRKPSDPHAVFPTFLLPSVPFRRKSRQSSSDSTFSTTSTLSNASSSTTSSNPFTSDPTYAPIAVPDPDQDILPPTDKFLNGHSSRIHCAKCSTDLCLTSQIISKGFTGRHGRAYLVQGTPSHIAPAPTTNVQLPNTYQNKAVPRNLVTGQHTVSDISCAICGSVLGWKYVEANEESQKYKVGKFILETKRIRVGVSWEAEEDDTGEDIAQAFGMNAMSSYANSRRNQTPPEDELEFDSQDEDECEDLFAGVWSPQLAAKRRARKNMRFGHRGRRDTNLRARSASSTRMSGFRTRSEETVS